MATEVAGFKELYLKLDKIEKRTPAALANAAYDGMQDIMLDAKEQAPKDTTMMARSGYVVPPEMHGGGRVEIESGFGGGSEEYVTRQHEDTGLNHPNGGNAKFFSNAVDAGRGRLLSAIAAEINLAISTGRFPRGLPAKRVPASPTEDVPPSAT